MSARNAFAIVGGGKMGEAILSGWLASAAAPADVIASADITVVEPTAERRAYLSDTHGVACVLDVSGVQAADVVVLAVKPQVMFDVLEPLSQLPAFEGGAEGPLFVSIAAGLTTDRIAAALPQGACCCRPAR